MVWGAAVPVQCKFPVQYSTRLICSPRPWMSLVSGHESQGVMRASCQGLIWRKIVIHYLAMQILSNTKTKPTSLLAIQILFKLIDAHQIRSLIVEIDILQKESIRGMRLTSPTTICRHGAIPSIPTAFILQLQQTRPREG